MKIRVNSGPAEKLCASGTRIGVLYRCVRHKIDCGPWARIDDVFLGLQGAGLLNLNRQKAEAHRWWEEEYGLFLVPFSPGAEVVLTQE